MVGDESSFLRRIAYSTAFLKAHSPSLAPPPSAPAPQCVPKTVSPSVKALARNPPPHSASSHYRLSPDLKSCRWLSCVKIQTPPEQFPDYAHLNPPKTSSALSFTDFFLFSARHSKLSTQPVPAQGVTPQWIYYIKRILGSPRLLSTLHLIQPFCTSL